MNVFLDIETIPSTDPHVLERIRKGAFENFKAPASLTKEQAAVDLGITDPGEIKFTSKDSMLAKWVDRFREEKAEEFAQEQWRKTSFDGASGHIAVIGIAMDNDEPLTFYSENWRESETEILIAAFEVIADAYAAFSDRHPVFIGHYITEFDLRFMFQRAVILDIKPPSIIPFHARPWDDYVFDTMTRWAGVKGNIKLDRLCAVLGIPGKDGMDGSMVWDFVRDGKISDVARYCANDVRMARAAYQRMTFAEAA